MHVHKMNHYATPKFNQKESSSYTHPTTMKNHMSSAPSPSPKYTTLPPPVCSHLHGILGAMIFNCLISQNGLTLSSMVYGSNIMKRFSFASIDPPQVEAYTLHLLRVFSAHLFPSRQFLLLPLLHQLLFGLHLLSRQLLGID